MHPASLASIAVELARERQRHGERLARLLPPALPGAHGATRRRLARMAARVAWWLDDAVVPAGRPGTSHGV